MASSTTKPSSACSPSWLLLAAVLLAAVLAGCGAGPARQDAAEPESSTAVAGQGREGCVVDGHFMAVGEVFNTGPEPCNTYTCHAADTVFALTCAWFTAGEGCEIVPGNQSSVYPHCCPAESCSDNLINLDTK